MLREAQGDSQRGSVLPALAHTWTLTPAALPASWTQEARLGLNTSQSCPRVDKGKGVLNMLYNINSGGLSCRRLISAS